MIPASERRSSVFLKTGSIFLMGKPLRFFCRVRPRRGMELEHRGGGEDCRSNCTHHTWPPSNAEDAVWSHGFFWKGKTCTTESNASVFGLGGFFKDCLEDAGILILWFLRG